MLKYSSKEPSINKICLKHNFKLIEIVEPNSSKKENGFKTYKCTKCGKIFKKEISYLGGDY
jgi:hypothetical protein